ncbi:MAG: hypothetical protein KJ072_15955 [Verrucomicrobia bacterium]|nr:hypothetical protein [Verrucomicrobiota bacterium]
MATPTINLADADLLRAFVREGSEAAFRSLTERHVDLVLGTALRRTGHREAAQEITQNVFIALARKSAWLQVRRSLAGWLYRTTLLEARQWRRGETRRGQRELTAVELETTMKTTDARLSPFSRSKHLGSTTNTWMAWGRCSVSFSSPTAAVSRSATWINGETDTSGTSPTTSRSATPLFNTPGTTAISSVPAGHWISSDPNRLFKSFPGRRDRQP